MKPEEIIERIRDKVCSIVDEVASENGDEMQVYHHCEMVQAYLDVLESSLPNGKERNGKTS